MNDLDFAPSSFGFRSIRPKSRDERKGLFDKVLLEKSRLDQRVGYEARLQQANAPTTSSLLTSCISEGAGYISNADRFHSDTAGEEYAARQEALHKKNRAIEFRRNQVRHAGGGEDKFPSDSVGKFGTPYLLLLITFGPIL
jgi:hypothetical protein